MFYHVICRPYTNYYKRSNIVHERAVTHARIRITDIVGGAIAMSFGEKEFAARVVKT